MVYQMYRLQKERRKMISFVECSMAIQNVLMILLEICMILELILLLVRITCFSGKKKIVTVVAVFVVSFITDIAWEKVPISQCFRVIRSVFS